MARTPFKRTDRVASLVRQVLGELLTFEVKDPRVRGAAISDVEITGDLREARVFLLPPTDDAEAAAQMAGLVKASGFLRRELGQRIRLRVTPQLDFRFDHSIEYGNRIEQRLRELGLGDAGDDEGEEGDTSEHEAANDTLDESADDDDIVDGSFDEGAFEGDSTDDEVYDGSGDDTDPGEHDDDGGSLDDGALDGAGDDDALDASGDDDALDGASDDPSRRGSSDDGSP